MTPPPPSMTPKRRAEIEELVQCVESWVDEDAMVEDIKELLKYLDAATERVAVLERRILGSFDEGRDAAIELCAGLFEDSTHEFWSKEEISIALAGMRSAFAHAAQQKGGERGE